MREFRRRLLIFGYPLLEVATAYAVATLIGWGWMLLLLVAGIPVGFAIMRNAGDAAMRDVITSTDGGPPADSSRHALSFVGGLLIAVPGFWTDLMGLLLVHSAHPATVPAAGAHLVRGPGHDRAHARRPVSRGRRGSRHGHPTTNPTTPSPPGVPHRRRHSTERLRRPD